MRMFSRIQIEQGDDALINILLSLDIDDPDIRSKIAAVVVDCEALSTSAKLTPFITSVYLWERDARVLPDSVLDRYPFIDSDQVERVARMLRGDWIHRSADCFKMSDVYHEQDASKRLRLLVDVIVGFASDCSKIAEHWSDLKELTTLLPEWH